MTATTIAEFSREAAQRYLQSAVFIDDNIYERATATLAAPEVIEARMPKPAIFDDPARLDSTPPPPEPPIPDLPFRTQDLVGSFAKHGIVCAPYEPERDFATDENSTVFKLCETADLVILDWDFHEVGLTRAKPKDLIARLVKKGNSVAPHHVRLIAVYTTTPRLSSVSSAVFDHLTELTIPVEPGENDALRLQCGSTLLIVLGKPGTGRLEAEQAHVLEEKDLADRLLEEFTKMNLGLLPSCALLGMAAVRRNSRRILDKFNSKLDGQFLLHRALVRKSEEAFDQLPELLADEFRAAIEDSNRLPDDLAGLAASAADGIVIPDQEFSLGDEPAASFLRSFLAGRNGYTSNSASDKLWRKTSQKKADTPHSDELKPHELAAMCSPEGLEHFAFGALLSGRTTYGEGPRTLCFGTVVREVTPGSTKIYSVCLMPACDSIRLREPASYPFWRLEHEGSGHAQCVLAAHDDCPALVLRGKIRDKLWMERFSPDSSRKVVVFEQQGARHIIKAGAREFEWVAQLKPAHAQRLAHAVGQSFSRVGLTEAEWLRLAHA